MNLKKMSEEGAFRKDLYFRLNVFPVEIPPLGERLEDIPHFSRHFLKKLNSFNTKEIHDIDPRVLEAFKHYSWPGNIRELENLIERAYILETSSILTVDSFPEELFSPELGEATVSVDYTQTLAEARRTGVEDIERNYLKEILAKYKGKIKEAAEVAGITTRQLHKLLSKHGIRKEEYKQRT
jgi:DNA-binding NtrC family response regulator